MQPATAVDPGLFDLGLLVIRVIFGLVFAAHGAQKLFGWFGGYGIGGTGGWMETLGFRPGRAFATLAGFGEFVGGLLLALGFLGAVGPALMLSVMLVALIVVHRKNGLFATKNGIELPLLFATAAVGISLIGPGRYSVDQAIGDYILLTPTVTWIVLGIGFVGGVASVAMRRQAAASPAV